jgi:hypothetical protein
MNWIRIATKMKSDPRMGAIAAACKVRVPEAVGLVCCVLMEFPDHVRDGDVASVDDVVIEQWAGWNGKVGTFGAAFRRVLCDEVGVVRAWEKHNGAALRRLESDLERKRRAKAERNSAEIPQEFRRKDCGMPPEFHPVSAVDETRRDVTASNTDDDGIPSPSSSGLRDVLPMVAATGHMALGKLFANVGEPDVWAGIIRGMASGLNMDGNRPAGPERLAAAIEDYVAQGHHLTPNPSLFRGFVKRAKAPDRGRFALQQSEDEYNADLLRTIREQNDRARMRGDAEKPIPTWANRIDATFPDGRTWPSGAAA